MAGKPHNPIKTLAILNLILLAGLIIFIVVAKQKSSDGTTLGYFAPKNDEEDTTSTPLSVGNNPLIKVSNPQKQV